MPFDLTQLPSQAIFPLGLALTHLAFILYLVSRRRPNDAIDRLFILYLFLTILWDISLVVAVNNVPEPLPGLTWGRVAAYGLLILGGIYWAFARAFLRQPHRSVGGWVLGGAGLILALALDLKVVVAPEAALAGSNGWLNSNNLGFVLSVMWWALFMALTAQTTLTQQYRTQNPAHRNRIQYLLIATLMLAVGYGLYLTLREPFWTVGLITTGLGGALATYIVTLENLLDLGTGLRRLIRGVVVVLVTVLAYILGLYLVQIFLGEFLLTNFAGLMNETLLITSVTVIFLAIFYMPIRNMSQRVANRLLFGQAYDYEGVIQGYGQIISNRLYLLELAQTVTSHLEHSFGLQKSALFTLEAMLAGQIILRALLASDDGDVKMITLQKGTPITQRLLEERRPLAQYTVDISNQFKQAPSAEREALQKLDFEWFIPIQKKEQLLGLLAVGTKKSGQPYSARDLNLLTTLADQTALALENATLFDRVQRNLEEITRMNNLMDNVFDSMANGVITTNTTGNITFYNRAAEIILGKSLDRCIGTPYTQVFPSLANTIFSKLVKNVIDRAEHYNNYEIISDLPERGRVNLSFSLTALKDSRNQIRGATIVMDDLTETKRLQAVHDMFRRYVSPAVVDRLPADPNDLELGGHRQEVSIIFADIRGFTGFSEHLGPEALVDVLNQYLSIAATAILMYEGTLDKFMGDAVMGIFNAPLQQADHALRAVRAAAAMQRAIADYHHNIGQERGLQFGIGLHTGEVVVGNIGMSDRMDYTAVGDAVNLAKRIQENAPGGKIIMSEAIYGMVAEEIEAVFVEELQVKGRQQWVKLYELRSM